MFKQQFRIFSILSSSSRGFSLLEILVALTLLGLIAAFVGGRLMDTFAEGKVKTVKIQMSHLSDRLKEFRRHCGFYPMAEQGLQALISKPTAGRECKRYRTGGYLEDGVDIPLDPWDNDYVYESNGRIFNIISLGGDGLEGGDGFDADISFRKRQAENQL